jgi:hypothetical protein
VVAVPATRYNRYNRYIGAVMSDDRDYGSGDPVDLDLAVGLYALRTFRTVDGQLASVVQGTGHWGNGVCEARCLKSSDADHKVPADDCHCGIYGTHTLEALFAQYGEFACRIVTVIAAEGRTVTGLTGLRTAAARIVAYWCAEPDRSRSEADVCAEQCPGARRFYDLNVMARLYGLGLSP